MGDLAGAATSLATESTGAVLIPSQMSEIAGHVCVRPCHRTLERHSAAAADDDGRAADRPEQFGGGIIVVPSLPSRRQIVRRPPVRPYVQALEVGHAHSPGA